ncbi:hypothetical protein COBT_000032 [Conglomerata obtusa]
MRESMRKSNVSNYRSNEQCNIQDKDHQKTSFFQNISDLKTYSTLKNNLKTSKSFLQFQKAKSDIKKLTPDRTKCKYINKKFKRKKSLKSNLEKINLPSFYESFGHLKKTYYNFSTLYKHDIYHDHNQLHLTKERKNTYENIKKNYRLYKSNIIIKKCLSADTKFPKKSLISNETNCYFNTDLSKNYNWYDICTSKSTIKNCIDFLSNKNLEHLVLSKTKKKFYGNLIARNQDNYYLKNFEQTRFINSGEYLLYTSLFQDFSIYGRTDIFDMFFYEDITKNLSHDFKIKFYAFFTSSFSNLSQFNIFFTEMIGKYELKTNLKCHDFSKAVLFILTKYKDQIVYLFPQIDIFYSYIEQQKLLNFRFYNDTEMIIYICFLHTFILFVNFRWKNFFLEFQEDLKEIASAVFLSFKKHLKHKKKICFFISYKIVFNEIMAFLICPFLKYKCFMRYVQFLILENICWLHNCSEINYCWTKKLRNIQLQIFLKLRILFFADELYQMNKKINETTNNEEAINNYNLNLDLYKIGKENTKYLLNVTKIYFFRSPNMFYHYCNLYNNAFHFLNVCYIFFTHTSSNMYLKISQELDDNQNRLEDKLYRQLCTKLHNKKEVYTNLSRLCTEMFCQVDYICIFGSD